ncbi:MAG: urea ABC transporter permease subunit UrtB [Pseudomonadota bacterium]
MKVNTFPTSGLIEALRITVILIFVGLLCLNDVFADEFEDGVKALASKDFATIQEAATALSRIANPRVSIVLGALIESQLFYTKKEKRVVIAKKNDDRGYDIIDAITGKALGAVGRRDVKKISVNNKLRRIVRGLAASVALNASNPQQRLEAISSIVAAGIPELRQLLLERLTQEEDKSVIAELNSAIAVFDLDATDAQIRLKAIQDSANNLDGRVRIKLTSLAEDENESAEIRTAAQVSLKKIEQRVSRFKLFETLFFGISLGSVLVLAAIGLSITFGVMGVINMAHGELIMLGAYTTYVVQLALPNALEYSLFIAIPAAFIVAGLAGIAIERGVIRFLYGRPLETLLATFGVSLILQQTVRSIFSPLNRSVSTPEWMSGSLEIVQGLSVTYNRLYILLFMFFVFGLLVFVMQKTRLGLEVRAVTQNRNMARAMGVRSHRVDSLTFGLGAGIAGVAGVALSQLTNVGPNLGQGYIVDSFMVVVFGGVGNLWGTLVAGLSLGVMNKILEPAAGAVVAKILILVFIILFIQKRPRGLFPQRGRAAED